MSSVALRIQSFDGWRAEPIELSDVLPMLRRASEELKAAEKRAAEADGRAFDAEQRLHRLAEHSATTIAEVQRRLAALEVRASEDRRQLEERVHAAELARDEMQGRVTAAVRSAEDRVGDAQARAAEAEERAGMAERQARQADHRAGEAEERSGLAEERAAAAESQAREAERRAETADARALVAEQRLEKVRDALGPDARAVDRRLASETIEVRPAPIRPPEPTPRNPVYGALGSMAGAIGLGPRRRSRLRVAG